MTSIRARSSRSRSPLLAACIGLAVGVLVSACRHGALAPAALDTEHDMCQTCRMIVSDARFAAEIVAPNEEPRFFDNLGCLETFLDKTPGLSPKSAVYVADHRTRAWVLAARAVYTRVDDSGAPMGSPFLAHASAASRDADPDARRGVSATMADVFGNAPVPGGGS